MATSGVPTFSCDARRVGAAWPSVPSIVLSCSRDPDAASAPVAALRKAGWSGAIEVMRPGASLPRGPACALLLAGGVDIEARHWDRRGTPPWPGPVDPERDAIELHLAREAWSRRVPVLGLCRGAQLLAVSRGGTLHPDIPSLSGCDPSAHQHGTATDGSIRHRVRVHPRSRLLRMLGHDTVTVNSRHHQAVEDPGDGLVEVAHDHDTHLPDGPLCEAIEAEDPERWVLGVQWHPENLVHRTDGAGSAARRLFAGFVRAAMRAFAGTSDAIGRASHAAAGR